VVRAFLSSVERSVQMQEQEPLPLRALFGNVEVKAAFGDARFAAVVVDVLFGSVQITVDDDVDVALDCSCSLGSVELRGAPLAGGAPRQLRVLGRVRLGALEVIRVARAKALLP
jgi:hypothetical protein